MGGLNAATGKRAVVVGESGAVISLRIRRNESYAVKRSVTQGAVETGYKISDGTVTEQPVIEIEGVVTGSDGYALALDPNRINAEIASINNAFSLNELVSVYASFIVVSDAVLVDFKAEATPKDKTITVKLTVQKVKFVNFQRTKSTAPAPKPAKTKNPAGKSGVVTGKKSAIPVEEKEKEKLLGFKVTEGLMKA